MLTLTDDQIRERAREYFASRRAARERILRISFVGGILLIAIVAVLFIRLSRHWKAVYELSNRGWVVDWSFDRTNWLLGGSSLVKPMERRFIFRASQAKGPRDYEILQELLNVETLDLTGVSRPSEEEMASISLLTSLRELNLDRTIGLAIATSSQDSPSSRFGDPVIERLRPLRKIERLNLAGNLITDDGVANLAEVCPELIELDLDGTKVTDRVFEHLKKMKSLQSVRLVAVRVTYGDILDFQRERPDVEVISWFTDPRLAKSVSIDDESFDLSSFLDLNETHLQIISEMTDLRELIIDRSYMARPAKSEQTPSPILLDDDFITRLRPLARLERLVLTGQAITDVGAARIVEFLPELRELDLARTRVGDGALEHLKKLKNLRKLSLYETRVTKAGAERFRKDRPEVEVTSRSAEQRRDAAPAWDDSDGGTVPRIDPERVRRSN